MLPQPDPAYKLILDEGKNLWCLQQFSGAIARFKEALAYADKHDIDCDVDDRLNLPDCLLGRFG